MPTGPIQDTTPRLIVNVLRPEFPPPLPFFPVLCPFLASPLQPLPALARVLAACFTVWSDTFRVRSHLVICHVPVDRATVLPIRASSGRRRVGHLILRSAILKFR